MTHNSIHESSLTPDPSIPPQESMRSRLWKVVLHHLRHIVSRIPRSFGNAMLVTGFLLMLALIPVRDSIRCQYRVNQVTPLHDHKIRVELEIASKDQRGIIGSGAFMASPENDRTASITGKLEDSIPVPRRHGTQNIYLAEIVIHGSGDLPPRGTTGTATITSAFRPLAAAWWTDH